MTTTQTAQSDNDKARWTVTVEGITLRCYCWLGLREDGGYEIQIAMPLAAPMPNPYVPHTMRTWVEFYLDLDPRGRKGYESRMVYAWSDARRFMEDANVSELSRIEPDLHTIELRPEVVEAIVDSFGTAVKELTGEPLAEAQVASPRRREVPALAEIAAACEVERTPMAMPLPDRNPGGRCPECGSTRGHRMDCCFV